MIFFVFLDDARRNGFVSKPMKELLFTARTAPDLLDQILAFEHTILSHGRSVFCKHRFIHYDFKDMTHWVNKMNWYATDSRL